MGRVLEFTPRPIELPPELSYNDDLERVTSSAVPRLRETIGVNALLTDREAAILWIAMNLALSKHGAAMRGLIAMTDADREEWRTVSKAAVAVLNGRT